MKTFAEIRKMILEMPEHRPETKDQSAWITISAEGDAGRYITDETVQRRFDLIKTVKNSSVIGDYTILLTKTKGMAGVYIPTIRQEDGAKIYYVACLVHFKHPLIDNLPAELEHKKQLQISIVATVPNLEGLGLASSIYQALMDDGYVIVSDNVQYEGGKRLWKKLSIVPSLNVFVYDTIEHDFIKDDSGKVINYDTKNLADDKIWLPNSKGRRFVLIAHK
jgi:hypothetical protein